MTAPAGPWFTAAVDEVTAARARRGEAQALEALYRAFAAPVYTLARRMCGSPQAAEDVLQETFLEVVRSVRRFRGDGSLAGWVRRVAVSKALMHLRRDRTRGGEEPLDEALPPAGAEDGGSHPTVDGERAGARVDLETALALLSPTGRAVVWLHDVEGYTHDEIGELLGKTASFSKSQLSRAYARMRSELARAAGRQSCT